jgi:uncharacterized protein (DUF697 family)
MFFIDTEGLDNCEAAEQTEGHPDQELGKAAQVLSSIAGLQICVSGRGRVRMQEVTSTVNRIKLSCLTERRQTSSPIAVVMTDIGIPSRTKDSLSMTEDSQSATKNFVEYEEKRKEQDERYHTIFLGRCEARVTPENLAVFLQPKWRGKERENYWASMKEFATFIIRAANNTKSLSVQMMKEMLNRTADCVERLPWGANANVTEILRALLSERAADILESIGTREENAIMSRVWPPGRIYWYLDDIDVCEFRDRAVEDFKTQCRDFWPDMKPDIRVEYEECKQRLKRQIRTKLRNENDKKKALARRRRGARAIAEELSRKLASAVGAVPIPLIDWAVVSSRWRTLIRRESFCFGFDPTDQLVERWVDKYSGQAKSLTTLCKVILGVGWIPGGIRGSILAESQTKRFEFAYLDALFECVRSARAVSPLIRDPEEVWSCFVSPFDQ